MVVIGCLWACGRMKEKQPGDVRRFLMAFGASTGFFAVAMWLFQPRYLVLFPRRPHPHWPW